MRRIAIVGCRPPRGQEWNTPEMRALYSEIIRDVERFVGDIADRYRVMLGNDHAPELVSGGASGVDSAAEGAWAVLTTRGASLGRRWIFKPEYDKHEPSRAPLERNTKIVATCTELHAWPAPWSRGTWDTVRKARAAGKLVTVHEVKP